MTDELAHDVRGALQVVRLALEAARRRPGPAAFDAIDDALDGEAAVVADGEGDTDLAEAIPRWMGQLAPALSHATVHVEMEGAPVVAANRVSVQRVVQNLVLNAARHAGPAPSIRIAWEDGLCIEDDGPGIEGPVHAGLRHVQDLVESSGGRLRLEGPGTRWLVQWPLGPVRDPRQGYPEPERRGA